MSFRFVAAAVVLATALPLAQSPTGQPATPTVAFQVASVKRNVSASGTSMFRVPTDGAVIFTNATILDLIMEAYQIDRFMTSFFLITPAGNPLVRLGIQEPSVPRFDVQGTPARDAPPGQQRAMLRTLLAERFGLRVHTEARPTPVFMLTVARAGQLGPALRPSTVDCVAFTAERSRNQNFQEPRSADGRFLCATPLGARQLEVYQPKAGVSELLSSGHLNQLGVSMQPFLGRPVFDETQLTGTFEWNLVFEFGPDSAGKLPRPILTALESQLGLKVEQRTVPLVVLVIDSVAMPSDN